MCVWRGALQLVLPCSGPARAESVFALQCAILAAGRSASCLAVPARPPTPPTHTPTHLPVPLLFAPHLLPRPVGGHPPEPQPPQHQFQEEEDRGHRHQPAAAADPPGREDGAAHPAGAPARSYSLVCMGSNMHSQLNSSYCEQLLLCLPAVPAAQEPRIHNCGLMCNPTNYNSAPPPPGLPALPCPVAGVPHPQLRPDV